MENRQRNPTFKTEIEALIMHARLLNSAESNGYEIYMYIAKRKCEEILKSIESTLDITMQFKTIEISFDYWELLNVILNLCSKIPAHCLVLNKVS